MATPGCPAWTPKCVSQKNKKPDERTRPASHVVDEPRELTINFLHRDCGGGIFPGRPAVRHPVTGFRIAYHLVRRPIGLRIRFTSDDILSCGDLVGAAHEVDRDCGYGLRLVIKDLDRLCV